MIVSFFFRSCFFVAPWLAAVGLLVTGCESPRLLTVLQDEKPKLSTVPPAPPPRPAPGGASPPIAALPAPAPSAPGAAPSAPAKPSLTPYLYRPAPMAPLPPSSTMPMPPPTPLSGVRVALLLPRTGPSARLGSAMLNAAQLAFFAFADDNIELLIHDTQGTPEGAYDAAAQAIGEGASLILGPLLANSVRAVAPAARAANVTVIAFSSDRTVSGDGVYTMGFFPDAEVERVAAYARSRGVVRFAALAPDNDYGKTVVDALRRAAAAGGSVVGRVQFYDPGAGDFSAVVRRLANYDARRQALLRQRAELKARGGEVARQALKRLEKLQTIGDLPFDALLVADGGKRLQAIAALLPFYDIDPFKIRMLGTGLWDEPGIGAEPALVGGWFAAPPPAARADFEQQFNEVYGRKPPRLATLAYDAAALAATLAKAEGGPDFGPASLTSPSGYWGRDGIFRFLPQGGAERGLSVLQVRPRGLKVIDKAPVTFEAVIY